MKNDRYNYIPLTEKIVDKNKEQIKCSYEGAALCQIHNDSGCTDCPVFKAILRQLNAFENIYMNDDEMTM